MPRRTRQANLKKALMLSPGSQPPPVSHSRLKSQCKFDKSKLPRGEELIVITKATNKKSYFHMPFIRFKP